MRKKTRSYNYDFTLDLHGKNLDESIFLLEKAMFSGNYKSVMIIHGHGEGILRNGIRNYLSSCKYAKDTIYGEDLNLHGGSGVTIIYL